MFGNRPICFLIQFLAKKRERERVYAIGLAQPMKPSYKSVLFGEGD